MNKQRLLELAGVIGIGSNMGNPSQEIDSEVPSAVDNATGAPNTSGYDELGDAGTEDPIARMRAEAEKGTESPEAAMAAVETILAMLDDLERIEGDDDGEDREEI